MKKYLFLPFAIVCLATGAAAGTSAGTSVGATVGATANPATSTDDSITKIAPLREIVNINRDWKFFSNTETDSDGATTVNLPHTWNHDALGGNKNYFRGIGNYMKEIEIPYRWQGRRVFIRCHGANSIANIMVNGKHAGEHRGGYTAFALEITERLRFGEKNHLWIMVNNSPQTDLLPTAGDQNSYGGLFRDVELIVTGAEAVVPTDKGSEGIYIKQRDITRERAEAEATVKIGGTGDANLTALLTVISAEGDTVARREARVRLHGRAISTVTIPFSVDKPRLWNGMADPYLYRIGIELRKGDATCDRIFTTTGFRWVSVEPGGAFVLNGEPYPVRGVVVTQDRSMVGTAITRGQVREDIELIREMGANAVRVLGVSHHPEFYDLCDSYGLLVWNDFPLVGAAHLTDKAFFDTESFRRNGEQQAGEIMARLYNHPSVVIWGLFSNLNLRGDDPKDYVRSLNLAAKREDPSRLTAASSNEDGEINFISDLIVWDHYFGWREGMPSDIDFWRSQYRAKWKTLRTGISYAAGASVYQQEYDPARPAYTGNWHPESWQTFLHAEYLKYISEDPFFWGIWVGNMFDYGAASRTWGEGNGINDCGLVTFDRKYRKDAYYLYKANWNKHEPFVYIAERRLDRHVDGQVIRPVDAQVAGQINRQTEQLSPGNRTFRVFTNCPEAELFVNGISFGSKTPLQGVIEWGDVPLKEGGNSIEARCGGYSDSIMVTVVGR